MRQKITPQESSELSQEIAIPGVSTAERQKQIPISYLLRCLAAPATVRNRIAMAGLALFALLGMAAADEMELNFKTPPATARPWVYWFWLNGNLTMEGMTADLEAMQRAGIGGVLIMEVDQGSPVGPVAFMSDRWRELFKHMVSEAGRLGLEVNMNNDAGWNGSGGPWVPLDKASGR